MNERKYKAVLFDLDGTLTDSMYDIARASNRALTSLGLAPLERDEYKTKVGWGLKETIKRALPEDASDSLVEEGFRLLGDFYKENPTEETIVYEGIPETLEALSQKGLELFVYTNKAEPLAVRIVETLFGAGRFSRIWGAVDHRPMKPHREGIRSVVAESGYSSEEILYIGDSEVDMETALAGDLDALAVLWGYRTEEQLKSYSRTGTVVTPGEILNFV